MQVILAQVRVLVILVQFHKHPSYKVDRLRKSVEPSAALFRALGILLAFT